MNAAMNLFGGPRVFGHAGQEEALLSIPGEQGPVACLVCDVSVLSVVLLTSPKNLPQQFDIFIPSLNMRYTAEVSQRMPEGVLLSLIARHPDTPAAPAATPASLGLPPRAGDAAASCEIMPVYTLGFQPDAVNSTRGTCSIAIKYHNGGKIDAHQPFLCLPLLGLTLEAAADWQPEDIVVVRKMRRFTRPNLPAIAPGETVHVCNILLRASAKEGGFLEYEAGKQHRFNDLRDLKLTTIVGAGNYPSVRIGLSVPAAEILAFFTACAARGEMSGFDL